MSAKRLTTNTEMCVECRSAILMLDKVIYTYVYIIGLTQTIV